MNTLHLELIVTLYLVCLIWNISKQKTGSGGRPMTLMLWSYVLDPDAEPDHRWSLSVHLWELAVKDQRATEDEGVWTGSDGGRGGDGGEDVLHHPSPDQWHHWWVMSANYSLDCEKIRTTVRCYEVVREIIFKVQ